MRVSLRAKRSKPVALRLQRDGCYIAPIHLRQGYGGHVALMLDCRVACAPRNDGVIL